MLYLIDGSNILYKSNAIRKNIGDDYLTACKMLISQVRSYSSRYKSNDYEIYFDGYPSDSFEQSSTISVVFSNAQSADELIKQRIRLQCQVQSIHLVSSDIELRNYAKIHSISSTESRDFLLQLKEVFSPKTSKSSTSSSKEKPSGTSRKEFRELLKLFTDKE